MVTSGFITRLETVFVHPLQFSSTGEPSKNRDMEMGHGDTESTSEKPKATIDAERCRDMEVDKVLEVWPPVH